MARHAGVVVGMLFLAHAAAAQFTQQGSKLVGTGAVGRPFKALSVAISADGNTAIVGGPATTPVPAPRGCSRAAAGCGRSRAASWSAPAPSGLPCSRASRWRSRRTATPPSSAGPPTDSNAGAAWVFTRSGGVWSQQGSKLVGTGAVGAAGSRATRWRSRRTATPRSSADPTTTPTSAPRGCSRAAGACGRSRAASWSARAPPGLPTQGISVAISADGNTAIVGGPSMTTGLPAPRGCSRAAVGCGRSRATSWSARARSGPCPQGISVAISADGNTAIVGGTSTDTRRSRPSAPHGCSRAAVGCGRSRAASWSAAGAVGAARQGRLGGDLGGRQHRDRRRARTTTVRPAPRGCSPAAAGCGRSRATSWSAPAPSGRPNRAHSVAICGGRRPPPSSADTGDNSGVGAAWVFVAGGCTSPAITSQPQSQSVRSGQTATLSVAATGTAPLSYQWYQGASGDTSTPVGTNASSFTTPVLTSTTSYLGAGEQLGRTCRLRGGDRSRWGRPSPISVWVPVASHTRGLNDSQWRSDLGLLNTGAVTANVQIKFFGSGGVVSNTTYVPPGVQSILTDVVGQLGASGSGAHRGPLRPAAQGHDAHLQPGLVGRELLPQRHAGAGLPGGGHAATGWRRGRARTSRDSSRTPRTAATSGWSTREPQARRCWSSSTTGPGRKLGDYPVTLAAGQWAQETQPFLNKARQTAMDRGYAKITVQSGSGVFAFASVIDNITNDPTLVTMQR